jgi:RHS repeat-associated protein
VETIDAVSGGKLSSEYRYHQGAWDGVEREFRGFGVVEQLDSETFTRDAEFVRFSPPTLTRTWFHQGSLQDRGGAWFEAGVSDTGPPRGDPPSFTSGQRAELGGIAQATGLGGDPLRLRHALRALRGAVLRSELYALDDSPLRDRPYTVTELLHDVREIEADDPSASTRDRVFYAFEIGRRDTRWERGTDPMSQFAFTGGYDSYGLPQTRVAVAVPRGRDPLVAAETTVEPYLATYSVTEYAQRDDGLYLVDRIARTTQHEVTNDGRSGVFALRDAVETGAATVRLIGHERTYYDGELFVGLPLGQLGEYGAPVRREALAFTDAHLTTTFDASDPHALGPVPCYLDASAPPAWTPEYPAGFKTALPPLAGYAYFADGAVPGSPAGYYVIAERRSYDFHDAAQVPRGLVRVTRDPLGKDTAVDYDAFGLFAVRVTDAVGLVTEATYDERVLLPRQIADPNGTQTELAYSPLGMVLARYVRGAAGEGDRDNPSLQFEYDLLAFAERGLPISVRSVRREHHDAETDVSAPDRDRTIATVEYSDGFGRLLQTRTQAEDLLFGDPAFGGGVLAVDPAAPDVAVTGRIVSDPVAVSGWQTYDNKGRVVEKYEPFFALGWEYRAPEAGELGQKVELFYDARGQLVRTRRPDGSEQLVVLGVPDDLTDPSTYAPTPWETYTYDANDNAGRTHGAAATAFESHWNTPASIMVDALGRIVAATARNGPDAAIDWYTTHTAYDIQGNVVEITDALGRAAFLYVYDLARRCWRVDSSDAGRSDTVPDVLGNPTEVRDSKGARTLCAYDVLHRPVRMWARDDASTAITLRHVLEYGDAGSATQPAADRTAARQANLLGRLARQHDEAGVLTIGACDFKGNVIDKSRSVIADAPLIAGSANAADASWNIPVFRLDWEPGEGQTLGDVEASLLDPNLYRTTASYDALGRTKRLQLPADFQGQRHVLNPSYNRAGGLEQVLLDGTLYMERVAYDARGRRTLIAYGNGLATRYAYDPTTFRLARRRTERFTQSDPATYAPAGGVVQDSTYRYDLAGNLLAVTELAPGSGILNNPDAAGADAHLAQLLASGDALIRTFAYDPIYRLTSATGRECDRPPSAPAWLDVPRCTDLTRTRGYTEQYRYDAAGSLVELSHQSSAGGFVRELAVESSSNRLQSMLIGQTAVLYAHDAAGNMLSETSSRLFGWNHVNQLEVFRTHVAGAEPSVYARYLYDGAGQRVKKLVRRQGGSVEVTHYIDGTFEHHRWGSGSSAGANNHIHVLDSTQRIALVRIGPAEPGDTTPAVQYQLSDQVGSSTVVIDGTGALVNLEEFTPYGETSFGSFAKKRYRFTGMERDEESSLSYHGARYYAPWLGRWSSPDPIGWHGGMNLYGYAHQNPITSSDPSGLDPDVNAFNQEIDKNGDNLITKQELDAGLKCSSMTRDSWLNQMAFDHRYQVDSALGREIDARLTSIDHAAWDERVAMGMKAQASPNRDLYDAKLYGDGHAEPSTAERVHMWRVAPAQRGRDVATLAVGAFSLWQPEIFGLAQIAHGIATHDGNETISGAASFLSGRLAKATATADAAPPSESASSVDNASTKDYRATFFAAHPELEGQVFVHHAIEQQVLTKFPGVVSETAIHALENLRGIPKTLNADLHLSTIRVEWNRFYKPFLASGTSPSLSQLVTKAAEIDIKYGHLFLPPVGTP